MEQITKKDLLKYIASFNKAPGEYTRKEIFKIAYMHKQLDEGKSWKILNKTLQTDFSTPESLRNWTFNQTKDKTQKELNDIVKEFKEIVTNSQTLDVEQKEYIQSYKEKTQVRDLWNTYRRNLREDARTEAWQDRIIEAINNLNTNYPLQKSTGTYLDFSNQLEGEAILLLSDLHIGVKCDNFYNKYNIEIAKERVNKLVKDTILYCRSNNIKRLTVLGLGDNIHGVIHTNARIEQEVDVAQQIIIASEIISQALYDLQEAAPEVIYRSVVDNHSRAIAQKEANLDSENFNLVIDFIIEQRLHESNIKIIKDNLDVGLGLFDLLNGKKFMFVHGHQDNVNSCFQNAVGATRQFIDYFAMGHYHSNKLKEFQGMTVFVNGSICGTEQYALGKRLFNNASQRLLIFKEDNIIDIKINLQ